MNTRKLFEQLWEREHQTTLRVMQAFPEDKLELKPAEKSKTARELLFVFVAEQRFMMMALDGAIDFAASRPEIPRSAGDIIALYVQGHKQLTERLKSYSDDDFMTRTVAFPVAPRTMGQVSVHDLAWMMLNDSIHHRGQLSVYLRLAGAKVPSIYGPTADEPWT